MTLNQINYHPYIVDIVLWDKIDSLRHKATVKQGNLHLVLYKVVQNSWESLENIVMLENDKTKVKSLKMESAVVDDELKKSIEEKRKDRRIADERLSVRKQMAVEELERNELESLKADEKKQAESEVYETFAKMEQERYKQHQHSANEAITTASKKKSNKDIFQAEDIVVSKTVSDDLDVNDYDDIDDTYEPKTSDDSVDIDDDVHTPFQSDSDIKYIPPPRNYLVNDQVNGNNDLSHSAVPRVDINFTPRVFPTPLRESKAAEEDDWIAKNKKHLKSHGLLGQKISKGCSLNAYLSRL